MDRQRRIRFYNPASEPPPQATASTLQPATQRFNHAQPQPSTSSTPVSRTTPDTLRTLEANWRERRRAKLEDITLQRAMGVEIPARGTARKARAVDDEKRGALVPPQMAIRTIATARRPLEPVITNLAPTSSDNGKPAPTALKTEPSTRSRRSTEEEDHATVTGNNTTSQGRTNRARKIVKLVRDARLSVQPVQGTVTMRDSGVSSSGKVHSEKETSPRSKTCCSPATAPTNVSSTPHPSSATAAPTKHPPNRPETSATPRRISEIRRIVQHSPDPLTLSSKRSPRPRCSGSPSRPTEPQPITASPLPAREYSLSPTSSLVVYPYEQDWSADLLPTPSPGKRTKRRPILSAMTGMERMDMVDGGMTMRIKPFRSAEGTRYLDLREQGTWRAEDRRRWEILGESVTRLKSRTRRVRSADVGFLDGADVLSGRPRMISHKARYISCVTIRPTLSSTRPSWNRRRRSMGRRGWTMGRSIRLRCCARRRIPRFCVARGSCSRLQDTR